MIGSRISWVDWPERIKRQSHARFIAYGTLINRHSIGTTLSNAVIEGPVIASGVRRIFNFVLEDGNYQDCGGRYARSAHPHRRATLNVLHTEHSHDRLNGVLFSVPVGELQALAEREYGYDVVAVECAGADEASWAYIFTASKASPQIGHRVADDVLPNESAVTTCLAGAATYGKEFLEGWIDSCYLADETPLRDDPYYKNLIQGFLSSIA